MTSRGAVLAVFALVVVSQPVQWWFVANHGEPYPSLSMPPFAGTGADTGGTIRVTSAEVWVLFAGGDSLAVSPLTLLNQAPLSHRSAILAHMFAPRGAPALPAGAAASGWRPRLKRLLVPGRLASAERRAAREADPETRAWLAARCRALFPARAPVAVSFRWFRDTYAARRRPVTTSREWLGTYDVQLDDAR